MSIKTICTALLASLSLTTFARPQVREVVIDTVCQAPLEQMLKVVDRFYYQFQACPDSLFEWAYLGLEEQEEDKGKEKTKESRDVIQLRYKDRTYDPVQRIGDVAIDIYVLGSRWWKDQHLVTQNLHSDHTYTNITTAHMTATYSGAILDGGDIIVRLEPVSANQTKVHYEFSLKFGRILSMFISDKMWQNSIEWRFAVILENLIECAETGTVQPKVRGPKK